MRTITANQIAAGQTIITDYGAAIVRWTGTVAHDRIEARFSNGTRSIYRPAQQVTAC